MMAPNSNKESRRWHSDRRDRFLQYIVAADEQCDKDSLLAQGESKADEAWHEPAGEANAASHESRLMARDRDRWEELESIAAQLADGEGCDGYEGLRLGACWRIAALARGENEQGRRATALGQICRYLSGGWAVVRRLARGDGGDDSLGLGTIWRSVCHGLLQNGMLEMLEEPLSASLCLRDLCAAYSTSDDDCRLGADVAVRCVLTAARADDHLGVGVALTLVETLLRRAWRDISARLVRAGLCELLVDVVEDPKVTRDNVLLAARAIELLADKSPLGRFALSLLDARKALALCVCGQRDYHDDDELVRGACGRANAALTEASVLLEVGVRNTVAELERRRWRGIEVGRACARLGSRLAAVYARLKATRWRRRRLDRLDHRLVAEFFDLVGEIDGRLELFRVFEKRVVPAVQKSAYLVSMVWTARLVLGRRRSPKPFKLVDCDDLAKLEAESEQLWLCVGQRLAKYEELDALNARRPYYQARPKHEYLKDWGETALDADLAAARHIFTSFGAVIASAMRVARPRLRTVTLLARLGRELPHKHNARRRWSRYYEQDDDCTRALPALHLLFAEEKDDDALSSNEEVEDEEDLEMLQCNALCEVSSRRAMIVELQRCKRLLDDEADGNSEHQSGHGCRQRLSAGGWYADGADPLFRKYHVASGLPPAASPLQPSDRLPPLGHGCGAPVGPSDYARLIEAIDRRCGEVVATDLVMANLSAEEYGRRRELTASRNAVSAVLKDVTDASAWRVAKALATARQGVEAAAGVRRALVARLSRARRRAGVAVGDRVEWYDCLGIVMRRYNRLANTWVVLLEDAASEDRPPRYRGARRIDDDIDEAFPTAASRRSPPPRFAATAERHFFQLHRLQESEQESDGDDMYVVAASQLRVLFDEDALDESVVNDYRISRSALAKLEKAATALEHLADERETHSRRETVVQALRRLGDAACSCGCSCSCWASRDVERANLDELRRLSCRAERAVATRASVFRARCDRLDELRRLCGSSRREDEVYCHRPTRVDDDDRDERLDSLALATLDDEIEVWEMDLSARKATFEQYAAALVRHWARTAVPTSQWLDEANRTSINPVTLGAGWLDAVALARTDDHARRHHTSSPPSLGGCFLEEARDRLVWWKTTWRNLTTCRVCYEPMPRAHLLGLRHQAPDDNDESENACCAHVGDSCVCCAREYARAALGDASRVSPDGLACYDADLAGCKFVMTPRWLADHAILTQSEAARLARFARQARLRGGDKCWCPKGCDLVIDLAAGRACPACGVAICAACRQAEHHGDPCAARSAKADLSLADLSGWQACPDCSAIVEKTEACDHMTCLCGAAFCYNCGKRGHDCPIACPLPRKHPFAAAPPANDDDEEDGADQGTYRLPLAPLAYDRDVVEDSPPLDPPVEPDWYLLNLRRHRELNPRPPAPSAEDDDVTSASVYETTSDPLLFVHLNLPSRGRTGDNV